MTMGAIAAALLYALFAWWFSTGLVLFLVLRRPRARAASLVGAALLFPACVVALARADGGTGGTYLAFTAALVLWGTIETSFLSGAVTGPRTAPCPPGARGLTRFRCALGAILWHELALLATGGIVWAATAGTANRFGALTFAVLWVMRLSAKLNLYFGVPVLNDAALPAPVAHLRTYFRRAPASPFFPASLAGATLLACLFASRAVATGAPAQTGHALVAALVSLAILEHAFMVVPLPVDRLWRWSSGRARRPDEADGAGLLRKALPTRP